MLDVTDKGNVSTNITQIKYSFMATREIDDSRRTVIKLFKTLHYDRNQ